MSSSAPALAVLLVSGAVGLLGVWQLLAGGSRRAELAARGRAAGLESSGRSLVRTLDARLRRTHGGRRLGAWLAGAGVRITPAELIGVMVAGGLAAFVVLSLLLARGIAFVAAAIATVLVTRALIERRRGNRRDAFVAQLPEVARMLSNGAAAGLSMQQSIRMASRELADPAGAELKRVIEEVQVGRPVEDALEALSDRLPSREVAVLMTTIAIQQRAGGDTVRALGELASTLDARKDLRREIATLLSGVVFTSYVVAGIGGATILMINAISPGVTQDMTSSPLGIAGLVVALILWTIAFVLIRRTTRIDV
ncbi:MAG TPA: type II secretion system F family protein [Solirubrobacter sp.]|nr:type II secretion system F family protein [Solirubrobacter sp.]